METTERDNNLTNTLKNQSQCRFTLKQPKNPPHNPHSVPVLKSSLHSKMQLELILNVQTIRQFEFRM